MKKKSICGCQEYLRSYGLSPKIKVIVGGVCRYCGTKQSLTPPQRRDE